MSQPPVLNAGNFAACETILKQQDRTAWLAALFAPERSRPFVHALYAFAHDVRRIPAIVSEPALGEIRLQWWREAVCGERPGEAEANPLSAALLETIRACNLPLEPLAALIDARRYDLYAEPMPSRNDLEGYCGETVSALLRLSAIALCGGGEPGEVDACGHGGVALGIVSILQNLPGHVHRGQCYIPLDVLERHNALPEGVAAGLATGPLRAALAELRVIARAHLEKARTAMSEIKLEARPALALLSQVEPLLRRMERRDYDPFGPPIELPQWRSQWAMWRF